MNNEKSDEAMPVRVALGPWSMCAKSESTTTLFGLKGAQPAWDSWDSTAMPDTDRTMTTTLSNEQPVGFCAEGARYSGLCSSMT